MRPRWMFGMVAVVLLAVPAGLQAQRAGAGGAVHAGGGSSGRSFTGNVSHAGGIRTIPTVTIANGSSAARPRANPFTVYGVAAPSRFAGGVGSPTLGVRAPHAGAFPNGNGANHKHHPRNPRGGAPQFYFLTGGYYYADPGVLDDSEGQTQDATDQRDVAADQQDEGQQGNDQQAEEQQPPDDQQRDYRADAANAPMPPQEQEQAPPLADVGSFTLVMRDGTQVDALAFTRAQDKIIYITPDGGRRTVAVSDIDSDSTARVNEERGTPLQRPL
ncbi:MAG: hypothetical protein WAN14_15610 [Candidatus Acidiferrales bacterium]